MFYQHVGPEPWSVMFVCLDNVGEVVEDELDFPLPAVIKGGDLMSPMGSSLSGDSGFGFATTSPRSQAMGFLKVTPPLHVACADDTPDVGLALPNSGLAEKVLAMSPMLYVQVGIGKVTMPALVDSGASSNFIDQGVADTLKLKLLLL